MQGERARARGHRRRLLPSSQSALLAGICIALGAAVGPSLAGAAADTFQDVVVRNSTEDPVITKSTGPERVQRLLYITSEGSGETCAPFDVPENKRFILEVAHFRLTAPSPSGLDGRLAVVEYFHGSGFRIVRYAPEHIEAKKAFGSSFTATRRFEGPLIFDNPPRRQGAPVPPHFEFRFCVGEDNTGQVTVVGRIEDL